MKKFYYAQSDRELMDIVVYLRSLVVNRANFNVRWESSPDKIMGYWVETL